MLLNSSVQNDSWILTHLCSRHCKTSAEVFTWVTNRRVLVSPLGGMRAVVDLLLVMDEAFSFGRAHCRFGHDDHRGLDTWECAHAALACRLHSSRPQFQVIIAGQPNERAPAQRPFKASPEPGIRKVKTKKEWWVLKMTPNLFCIHRNCKNTNNLL